MAAKQIEGTLAGAGLRVALVASRFNDLIVDRLIDGALGGLRKCGVREDDVAVIRTPGAFELPLAARKAAESGNYDAVVCLGAVIRGGTPHFEYVCDAVTAGLTRVALDSGTPVGNGVLTCNTIEQARDRSGLPDSSEDKGWEAVVAALETAILLRTVRRGDLQKSENARH